MEPVTLAYDVRRRDPELVGPALHTPRETKHLSDLDNWLPLRKQVSLALIFRGRKDGVEDVHPGGVIRRALGQALVQYYPLAGRLRETAEEAGERPTTLVVDCTGEGVLFVQADADVHLADLEAAGPGHGLRPPFPCWDQLLFEDGGGGVLNSPLLLIQVTRLLCGSFVLAVRFNHTICDGIGIAQFINAVSELARGLPSVSVTPVWSRELIKARKTTASSASSSIRLPPPPPQQAADMIIMSTRCFTFSASHIAAIKKSLPHPGVTTTFEALAAFLWRAHTAALEVPGGEDTMLAISANFRAAAGMSLPAGYYGNASPPTTVLVDAAALRDGSLGDAVALVRQAKATVTTEHFRSMIDALAGGVQLSLVPPSAFFGISDARRLGLDRVDFGWGAPLFAGPVHTISGVSFFNTVTDDRAAAGEDAVAVLIVLPRLAMERFTAEVDIMLLCEQGSI